MPRAPSALTEEQLETIAAGLLALAEVDGIDPRETALIEGFLRETGSEASLEVLRSTPFSPLEAAQILDCSWQRKLFVKLAIALVRADGEFSDAERRTLGEVADAFGLSNADFGQIEHDAARTRLE